MLLQQHYGIESPLLDITKDVDIALFFAQNMLIDNTYERLKPKESKPVIYVFILNSKLDPFIDSELLMKEFGALRPYRQKCGILSGSTNINKDFYSRFISLRIILDEPIDYNETYTPEYLFPDCKDDLFLKVLKGIQNNIDSQYIKPFELAT